MVVGTLWKRLGRTLVAAGGFALAAVLCLQLMGACWFADRILPGVRVAGIDIGGMTRLDARTRLDAAARAFRLDVNVDQAAFSAAADDIGLSYDLEGTVARAYGTGRESVVASPRRELGFTYTVDEAKLDQFAAGVAGKVGVSPVDATVAVRGATFSAVADRPGIGVEPGAVAGGIASVVASAGRPKITLASTSTAASVRASDLAQAIAAADTIVQTPVLLRVGERTFAPTPAQIASWLVFNRQADAEGRSVVMPTVERAKVAAYVKTVARQADIAPVDKKVNVENGISRVTQEGRDGQAIDQSGVSEQVIAALSGRTPLDETLAMSPVAFKTTSTTLISLDLGRYIEVNLSKQRLWVWQDHAVVYETPITSGATGAGFPTVTGLFDIKSKARNTRLRGYAYGPRYNYDVAVKYWMPFYSGYGFHDASWRGGNFGGQDFYYGGSHGCVNLPDAAAAWIYDWATVGTPVWVHK